MRQSSFCFSFSVTSGTAAPLLRDQATALPALRADLLLFGFDEDALAGAFFSRFDSGDNQCGTGVKARALIRAAAPHGITLVSSGDPFAGVLNGPWALQDLPREIRVRFSLRAVAAPGDLAATVLPHSTKQELTRIR